MKRKPNHLAGENSPYLLQHAYNPVDWYPWGEEAFSRARAEEKPIFLSVGYSTCHWCHVMERESFENDTIADFLNRHFVSIKVDREERPDVDRIYMSALQAMGHDGGWPMSMFLTPDLKPFYGGTYFPPETRYGRLGLPEVLARIQEVWTRERSKVLEAGESIGGFLDDLSRLNAAKGQLQEVVLQKGFENLNHAFDREYGGFGAGPKFPRPAVFNFLLRYHLRSGDRGALEMIELTLQKMSSGGIFDQVGGGFHRYAVDAQWRVPHFEKMIYDQAQLLSTLVDAYQVTLSPLYASVAQAVAGYVLRDLRSPEGAFFSAEDADSPRPEDSTKTGEGAFYVWTIKEIRDLLGNEADVFCHYYGLEEGGNVAHDPQQEFTGRNILHVAHSIEETAKAFSRDADSLRDSIAASRRVLSSARAKRPHPALDDKILTSWNGLMIGALARAASPLRRSEYLLAAEAAAEFVHDTLWRPSDGRLLHRYRRGESGIEGMLQDYAYFAQALLDLYEASGETRWLKWAADLTEVQIKLFWDGHMGGFFETTGEDKSVLVRVKDLQDGAEPSGNSVSALNLLKLSEILQRPDWHEKAQQTVAAASDLLAHQPVAMPNMLCALDSLLSDSMQIVVCAGEDASRNEQMLNLIRDRYIPNRVLVYVDGSTRPHLLDLVPWIASYFPIDGKATAFVCQNYVCNLPITDVERLADILSEVK